MDQVRRLLFAVAAIYVVVAASSCSGNRPREVGVNTSEPDGVWLKSVKAEVEQVLAGNDGSIDIDFAARMEEEPAEKYVELLNILRKNWQRDGRRELTILGYDKQRVETVGDIPVPIEPSGGTVISAVYLAETEHFVKTSGAFYIIAWVVRRTNGSTRVVAIFPSVIGH